jgi:hypothetical protein
VRYQRSPQPPARAQPRGASGSKATRLLAAQRAARVIQSMWASRARTREHFHLTGAREFARVARTLLVSSRAALRMQRLWRGSRIRKLAAEAIELKARRKARAQRRVDDLASTVRFHVMACRIQQLARRQAELRAWQRRVLQENELYFARMREELHRRTAITVQRYARGRLARLLAEKVRRSCYGSDYDSCCCCRGSRRRDGGKKVPAHLLIIIIIIIIIQGAARDALGLGDHDPVALPKAAVYDARQRDSRAPAPAGHGGQRRFKWGTRASVIGARRLCRTTTHGGPSASKIGFGKYFRLWSWVQLGVLRMWLPGSSLGTALAGTQGSLAHG